MSRPPLVPAGCDLRDFAFMPMDVVRLRDSGLAAKASGDEFRAALLLACAAWHQIPAGSLPDDDVELAQLSGYGRVVREWLKVRDGALRGWSKCDDGRLYHPVVAEKACESWERKLVKRWNTECARIRKHNERHHTTVESPDFDRWKASGCRTGQPLDVTRDSEALSQGQQRESASKGQGEGQGQGQGHSVDTPQPPKGGGRSTAVGLLEWMESVKAKGEKPIPEDDPVLGWANEAGIPVDFLRLAWIEFRDMYTGPGAKKQKDWRQTFRNHVRRGYSKLWWHNPAANCYELTTAGHQARLVQERKAAA